MKRHTRPVPIPSRTLSTAPHGERLRHGGYHPIENLSYFDPLDPDDDGSYILDVASPTFSVNMGLLNEPLLDPKLHFGTNLDAVDGFSLVALIPDLKHGNEEMRPTKDTKWRTKEDIRDQIKVLYLEEGNTLAVTRRMMKDKYNIDFSDKTYKQWLRDWGFKKYTNKPDKEYIVKTDKQRRLFDQKSSIFGFQGIIVSEAKIKQWAKFVDENTTISCKLHLPIYLSCITPPLRSKKRSESSCVATKRLRHKLDTDTAIFLLPLSLSKSSTAINSDFRNAAENPLYATFFLPLQQSVIQISKARLSRNDLPDRGTRDDIARELEDALEAFMEQCSQLNELRFALACFSSGGLSRLALDVFSNERWDVGLSINLPFLFCQARCLIASEQYSEGENLIYRILQGCTWIYRSNHLQKFKRAFPAVLLLAKTYLASSQTYLLGMLLRSFLAEAEAFGLAAVVDGAILQLQKMLLITESVMLTVWMALTFVDSDKTSRNLTIYITSLE
ncbi:hypothetical protein MMC11_007352 [Xylographa trunciseda]|nr:hypothetical protein [Xylographa trunciseda]